MEHLSLRNGYFAEVWLSHSKGTPTGEKVTGDFLWDVPVLRGGLSLCRWPCRDGFWIMALFPAMLICGLRILQTAFEATTAICTLFHTPEDLNVIVRF